MKWLMRYLNKNRKQIMLTVAIIAFIIIIIQIINGILEQKEEERKEYQERDPYKPSQSIITGDIVSEETTEKNTELIGKFVEYCNNKDYNNAFNLLSDNCKGEIFSNNIDSFIKNYVSINFDNKKTYQLKLLMNINSTYIYQITYYSDDLLATGGSNMSKSTGDYISIILQNNEEKINVKGLVKKNDINKTENQGDLEITINDRAVYYNKEKYNITFKNNSENTISIGNINDSESICLVDSNGVEYPSFIYELLESDLILTPGYSRTISITFNKICNLERNIEKVRLKEVNLNKSSNQVNQIEENSTTQIDIEM